MIDPNKQWLNQIDRQIIENQGAENYRLILKSILVSRQ